MVCQLSIKNIVFCLSIRYTNKRISESESGLNFRLAREARKEGRKEGSLGSQGFGQGSRLARRSSRESAWSAATASEGCGDGSGMNQLVSWSAEDEAVAATNADATECKRGAVELGYWSDPYVRLFARRAERRAPEINRGYYARVRAMEIFIHQFLERCDSKCQIINLGCGFDTLFWRLKDVTQAVGNFIEIDFPEVIFKKIQIIKRNKQLLEKITNEDGEVVLQAGDLHADGYHLAGADLRCVGELARKLAACGARVEAPTLVLAECVLVYLRAEPAEALLRHLAAAFPRQVLLVYEQCNLGDKFGEVMARNLEARGVGAPSALHAAGPGGAAARLLAAGYRAARAWDMVAVWRSFPEEERARVEALEPLDEAELLQQLHAHYALAVASNGDLFADIDLNA